MYLPRYKCSFVSIQITDLNIDNPILTKQTLPILRGACQGGSDECNILGNFADILTFDIDTLYVRLSGSFMALGGSEWQSLNGVSPNYVSVQVKNHTRKF
jgi:hypothetical protein